MKRVVFYIILSVFVGFIGALEVDRASIELSLELEVEFENYIGPHLFINTVEEIRSIGRELAQNIIPEEKGDAEYNDKYFMSHRPSLEWEDGKRSADIFHIGETALVDHIDNIELIISEYLIENYGYSKEDGDLLAHLLVLYNAVFRGDSEHFNSSYTSEAAVSEDNSLLGIDLHYSNWPGKSYIYIPLSKSIYIGRLNTIDSDSILDDKVIDLLEERDADSVELREEIIDLKEREFDELKDELELDLKELESLEMELNNITIEEDMEPEVVEELVETQKELNEEKLQLEEVIAEKKEEIEAKEEVILELRDDLAEDKTNKIVEERSSNKLDTFNFLLTREVDNETLSQLVKVDSNGDIQYRGSINSIRNRFFIKAGDSLFFIAGGERANQMVTLGKVNADDMTDPKWGDYPCYSGSPIVLENNSLYSIIEVQSQYYIGKFNFDLELEGRSILTVEPNSLIVFMDSKFYVQADDNSIKLVNLSDFTDEIE